MITSLKLCVVTVYFLLITFCDANDEDTLELVHVIFRHGSRTTDKNEVYPNDPHNVLPVGYGQLTNQGKQQAYRLGKLLRKKYKNFLDGEIPSETVWTETSEFPRTQVTALLVLAGLFPPTAAEKWSDELNWTPIPYYSREKEHDFVLWKPKKCPAYRREFERLLKSEQVSNFVKRHSQILNFVTERSGKQMKDLNDVFRLHQVLDSETARNLSLPNWTRTVFPKELKAIATQKLVYENGTPLLKRLYIGRILKIILDRMQQKSENTLDPNKKIILYSGHDNNVLGMLVALNLAPYEFPEYCSAVLIELHKSKTLNEYYVKVYHVKNVESEPEEKHIFNCKGACFLSEFTSILQPIIPKNLTEECGSTELLE